MIVRTIRKARRRVAVAVAGAGVVLCVGCAKDPCLREWGCTDCNCLFDKIQAAQSNLDEMNKLQGCYDRACK